MNLALAEQLPDAARRALLTRLDGSLARNRLADYAPYPKQVEFHTAGAQYRERLLMAANQSGKTLAGAFEHAMHLTGRYPSWWKGRVFDKPVLGWVASETSEITRDGVQRLMLGRLQDGEQMIGTGAIPGDAIIDWKKKPHGVAHAIEFAIIRHGGGGDVQAGQSYVGFKSYDQGRTKFQAETLDFVWFDEEPDADIYFEGLTRTNVRMGLCTVTFTPLKGMSAVVMRYLMDPPKQATVTRMGIYDAKHYSREQADQIIAGYPEHERKARAYGEPTLGSGQVYAVAEETIKVKRFEIPPHFRCIGGLDFGWDHPAGACAIAYDADQDMAYVYRAHSLRLATPVMLSAALRPWGTWLPWAWPHDGKAEVGGKYGLQDTKALAQLYADQGMLMCADHATFEDGSMGVEPGVMDILDRMQTGRWKVFDDLDPWWSEFRLYHRKDGKIVKLHDDILSAMRYAWMMRRFARTAPRHERDKKRKAINWRTL